MPNIVEYIYDYISDENEQNIDTILRFIASQQGKSILPILKYVSYENIDKSNLHETEKKKLKDRLRKQANLRVQMEALQYKIEFDKLEDIINEDFAKYKEYSLVAYNFDKIGIEKIKNYILDEIKKSKDNGEITVETNLRRLSLIYDLKKNKK